MHIIAYYLGVLINVNQIQICTYFVQMYLNNQMENTLSYYFYSVRSFYININN